MPALRATEALRKQCVAPLSINAAQSHGTEPICTLSSNRELEELVPTAILPAGVVGQAVRLPVTAPGRFPTMVFRQGVKRKGVGVRAQRPRTPPFPFQQRKLFLVASKPLP